MKKFLAGFISAIILSSVALAVADWTEVTATLRPGISIYMDGRKMDYKDSNGNSVSPVIIDGSTYLPLRGLVTSMGKEVGWNEGTQTITIGEAMPESFLDVSNSSYGSIHTKITGEANFNFADVDVSAVNGIKMNSAIKYTNINTSWEQKSTYELSDSYSKLEGFILAIPRDRDKRVDGDGARFQVFNADTDEVLFEKNIDLDRIEPFSADIKGAKNLRIAIVARGKGTFYLDSAYLLNPIVK